jgi:hypothetical protein
MSLNKILFSYKTYLTFFQFFFNFDKFNDLLKSEGQRQSSKPFDLKAFGKMAFGLQSAKYQTDKCCGQMSITKIISRENVL